MENVIFWLIVIGTGIWTLQWISNVELGLGHKLMIIPILLLWAMIIYFYKNPELSRYHMLWISPLIIIMYMAAIILIGSLIRLIRRN